MRFCVSDQADYVCAKYKDNYTMTKNFIKNNYDGMDGMDLDNEHSDNTDACKTMDNMMKAFQSATLVR